MIPSRINSSSHQQQLSSQDGDYLNPSDAMPSLSRLTGSEVVALNLSNGRPFAASLGFPSSLSPSANQVNSANQGTSMNQGSSANKMTSNYDQVLREGEKLRENIFMRQDSFFVRPINHYDNSQVADGQSEFSQNTIISQRRIQFCGISDAEELKASPGVPLISELQSFAQKSQFKPASNKHHFTATGHDYYSSTTQDGNGLRSSTQGGNQTSSTGGPQYAGMLRGNINFASNTNSNTFNNMNASQSISGQIGSLLDSSNDIQLNKQDIIWINNNLKNPSSKFKNGQIPLSRRVDSISHDDNPKTRNNSGSNPNDNNLNNLSNINDRSNINNMIDKINQENSDFIEKKNKRLSKLSILSVQANKISFKLFKKANLIKKFVQSLLKILPSRLFDKLEYKHFQIIGDVIFQASHSKPPSNESDADYLVKSQKQITSSHFSYWPSIHYKLTRAFTKMTYQISDTLPIFSPNSVLLVAWNTFLLVFLMTILIINPLLATFESSTSNSFLLILTEQSSIAVFGIQLLLNFNTGFYHEGEIIKSRYIIFQKYFRLYFWIDILSIVAIIFSTSYNIQYLKLVALIRIPQIFQILESTEEHFQLQQKFYTAYELTKLFALVFFVAHYCSCAFYEISRFDYENNANQLSWIKKYNVATEGWQLIYLDSLYFSFITMVTVGFGDIVPISVNEKIYVIFFTLISCGIFGYAVNTIGAIFQELSQKQVIYKLKKYEITKYMQGRGIERAPQIKVLKYLEYMNTQEEERNFLLKGEKILQTVSKNLREEVMLNFFGQILQNSVIFKNTFSSRLIEQLALRMKEVTLGPGDAIFSQGDIDNRLFYVFKGQVDYCLEQDHKVIKFGSYKVGDFFGQSGFFADIPRVFTAKSKGTTHLVICKQEDMQQLIKENLLDLEAFCLIRDEMLFKKNYIGHRCQSCGSTEHLEIQCDLVTLRVNKPLLIRKNNFSVDQQRTMAERHQRIKFRARKDKQMVAIHLKQFRTACIIEALENWDDLGILQDPKVTDQDFFLGLPKVKYEAYSGQMCQDSEDSIYSDEDIHIFSKDEMKISQDQESPDSLKASINLPEISLIQKSSQRQHVRAVGLKSRHQSTKVNSVQIEEIKDWNQMFRSKTKKETLVGSPSNRTKRAIPEPVQSQSTEILEPANRMERTENRHNTGEKSHLTGIQRGDSLSSIKSFHNRSASRNMSRFGAAAVAVAIPQLIGSNPKIEALHPPSGDKTVPITKGDSQVKVIEKGSEQFKDSFLNGQDQQYLLTQDNDYEFDALKEYTIYYPNNNLSQILRQIKKNWFDKFQKKRIKSKSTYKSKLHKSGKQQKNFKDLNVKPKNYLENQDQQHH